MIPTLTTARLTLGAFQAEDAPHVELLAGNEAVARTTLNIPHPYPAGAATPWIASHAATFLNGDGLTLAIRLNGELIGCIGLTLFAKDERGELGYWIAEPHWNRGYASEAAAACVRYGFETLGLRRIAAHHYPINPASGRVMEKIGMKPEGRLRAHVKKAGSFHDVLLYGILREEFLG
ncbi:GNAT family N-acetyltransferase [Oleiharenicola lentus]|uniref:GNAT family N-acetyltransferase n=1 Tax=Oleiharenicola lentus TaxID=2508720 RepID=UPI003F67F476